MHQVISQLHDQFLHRHLNQQRAQHNCNFDHHHHDIVGEQNKSVQLTSDDTSVSSESGDELGKLGRVSQY